MKSKDKTFSSLIIEARGNVICFEWETSLENYQQLVNFMREYQDIKFTKMIIQSKGGRTTAGRDIGHIMFDNEMDVKVQNFCFSSCVNYIFTAGKNKIIEANSIVDGMVMSIKIVALEKQ